MVFQAAVLLKWRTVLDNVLLPAELAGLERAASIGIARASCCGWSASPASRPSGRSELSGGMQQRASLCRALLLDPPMLLMDEPFGALDAMTRDEMNLELLRVWGEGPAGGGGTRKTIVFVTHSIPEAVFLADRVVVMSPRPGRVAGIHGGPAAPAHRRDPRHPEFGRLSLEIYNELSGAKAPRAAPSGVPL